MQTVKGYRNLNFTVGKSGYWRMIAPAGPAEVYFFSAHGKKNLWRAVEALVRQKKFTTE